MKRLRQYFCMVPDLFVFFSWILFYGVLEIERVKFVYEIEVTQIPKGKELNVKGLI